MSLAAKMEMDEMEAAMRIWEKETCIEFVPYNRNTHQNYVAIQDDQNEDG